jgi:D-alanine-D-alanine ligase
MSKIKKHIEIVRAQKGWLSSLSKQSAKSIYSILEKYYTHIEITTINNLTDLKELVKRKPDLVFLGIKFINQNESLKLEDPDKIWVAKYLSDHNILYTGSDNIAHNLEFNKDLAKKNILASGIQTSPFYIIKKEQKQITDTHFLKFPLFIKPTNRGGGIGIDSNSIAYNFNQLHTKVIDIAEKLQSNSLIEEYLPGREFSVAILKNRDTGNFFIMPIELVAPADKSGVRILSKEIKISNEESVSKIKDKILEQRIKDLAIKAFYSIGARDYARIDIRLDVNGDPQFLEANLIPSLIQDYGSFPKACLLNKNFDHEFMILEIVKLAFDRS